MLSSSLLMGRNDSLGSELWVEYHGFDFICNVCYHTKKEV